MEEAAVPMDEVVEQGGQGGDGSEAWNGRMVSMKWSGDGEMMLRWGDTLRTTAGHQTTQPHSSTGTSTVYTGTSTQLASRY